VTRSITALALLVAPLLAAPAAVADEAKAPVTASMILNIVAAPVQPRTSAYDEALKRPTAPPPDDAVGEVLPDGSVRYGRAIVTVKNPCPPGTAHYEPPPLPGRRPR
jgi:hypothetical protein